MIMSSKAVEDTLKTLDERVIDFINKYALSGMGVGIVQNGKLIYAKGFGLANAKTNAPITTQTNFRIASISKTFTAIAVMQLWEQGIFKLDDPVNNYLTSFKILHPDPNAPQVTIRHLLTHTSGIGEMRSSQDLVKSMLFGELMENEYKNRVPPLAEYYNGVLVPDVYPDMKWAYANNGFGALGQLVEDVSGMPFSDYMVKNIFDPLGMPHSDFILSDRVKDQLAQGYTMKKGRLVPVDYVEFPERAAGTVMSSVEEMGNYLAALMNGGSNEFGSVLRPETLKKMMTVFYQEHPNLGAMGLGFPLENLDGHWAAWHGGALSGFNSALWVAPDDKLGVFMSANSNTRIIYHFGKDVLRSLLGLPGYEKRLPKPDVMQSPHLWKDMVGTYAPIKGFNSNARIWSTYGGELEIYVDGSRLKMRSLAGGFKKGVELYPVDSKDPLSFENVTDGRLIQLAFQRNAEGFIDHISYSTLASYYNFYKIPEKQSLRFGLKVLKGAGIALGAYILLKKLFCRKK